MKSPLTPRFPKRLFLIAAVLFAGLWPCAQSRAQNQELKSASTPLPGETEAAEAWKAVGESPATFVPLAEWKKSEPSPEAIKTWMRSEIERLVKLADQAGEYYEKFPKGPHAQDARLKQRKALLRVAEAGDAEAKGRLGELEKEMLKDPGTPAKERYDIRSRQIYSAAGKDQAALERGARDLLKEFPEDPRSYKILLCTVGQQRNERSLALLTEILGSNASEDVKADAKVLKMQMDRIGKPLDIRFTALDGRNVDLQQMKGKVVLVDFWATWCGPCVEEIPHVKEAYARFHDKGFEVVGVSFDNDRARLEKLIKEKAMPWPQYFDPKESVQRFVQEFGIQTIPAMWLVDKKGLLRDINARQDLAGRVEKLLAEP